MELLDEMTAMVESKSRDATSVFKIEVNEKKKIRFLAEFNAGMTYDYHGRYYKDKERQHLGYRVPCPTSFKKYADRQKRTVQDYGKEDCPYCLVPDEKGITSTDQMFVWLIWNYTDGCVQAFTFKMTANTPIKDLIDRAREKGTITDRDFIIRKENQDNGFPITKITHDDPSKFIITDDMKTKGCFVPQNNAEAQKEMLRCMAKAWCPDLLNPSPKFELPDRLKPKDEEIKEIDAMFSDEDMLEKLPGMDGYSEDASLEDDLSRL